MSEAEKIDLIMSISPGQLCIVPNTGCTALLHATTIACSYWLDVMRRVRGAKMHVVVKRQEGGRLTASNKGIAVQDLGNVEPFP
ncbi:MAG: hypothetical protein FRX49_10989 [Trebouxia sp. A1-2]|nr:MAG: hypothetical protein FRX49_10989 [Trebouxia sp. A1-2]